MCVCDLFTWKFRFLKLVKTIAQRLPLREMQRVCVVWEKGLRANTTLVKLEKYILITMFCIILKGWKNIRHRTLCHTLPAFENESSEKLMRSVFIYLYLLFIIVTYSLSKSFKERT